MPPRDKSARIGSKTKALVGQLRQRIADGHAPGERLPSEPALGRQFRCSIRQVRNALAVLADEGLVERIQGSGTYVTESARRRTGTTGLLFYQDAAGLLIQLYVRDVLLGMLSSEHAAEQEVMLLLGRKKRPDQMASSMVDHLRLERLDSIVCVEVFNDELLARLAERVVTVAVDYACHRPGVSSCALDHRQTLALAVEQLRMLGHRRIGYAGLMGPRVSDPAHKARLSAYRQAMEASNLRVEPSFELPLTGAAEAVLQAQEWARSDPSARPTALICAGLHWPFVQTLITAGVRVPADVSILSLGHCEPWMDQWTITQLARPAMEVGELLTGRRTDPLDEMGGTLRQVVFSTVDLPFRDMGQWAMGEAVRRIEQPGAEPRFELFAGRLSPGNTLGPPPRS